MAGNHQTSPFRNQISILMKIGIIGSGNVADVLAGALYESGHTISFIYSRNRKEGTGISKKVKTLFIAAGKSIPANADIYIIALSDGAIREIIPALNKLEGIIVHTSGATPLDVLSSVQHHGVWYPVNSLRKNTALPRNTFFCIESSDKKTEQALTRLTKSIVCKPVKISSDERLFVHLAAVFANNFTNALLQSAFDILKQKHLPFALLQPLIITTMENGFRKEPVKMQTGPAARNDGITMKKHLKIMSGQPELRRIYKVLSALIKTQQTNSQRSSLKR
jgi:predicted short-subunit dehydrogenase-like oxidoreductase (DUF2520 family)